MKKNKIQFPKIDAMHLDQNEEFFYLTEPDGNKRRILFHDYSAIYEVPHLYEQLFYERLQCRSPKKVAEALHYILSESKDNFSELRVLDLGAGNGIMGEELKSIGCARLVGVDIIRQAYEACERDRPEVYDEYHVVDLCNLSDGQRDDLEEWSFNCLTTVAALGFGDIPAKAFVEAFNIINDKGWIALNIKETFLDKDDKTDFSRLIREIIFSDYFNLHYLERYRHRLSMEGHPLYYFTLAGRKNADISDEFLASIGMLDLS